jgi:hypothetical protein
MALHLTWQWVVKLELALAAPPPLASVALLKREARTRPRWNHRHGLSGWSVLYPCCDCDRSSPPVSRLLGEGRPKLPSPLDVMRNYSIESSIMAHHGDGVPLRVELMKVAPASPLLGERLRSPKYSAINSKFPKRTVSPMKNPPHIRRSPSAATVIIADGIIRTSIGKARYKSPFLACQLSVFSAPARTGWSRSRVLILRWSCELQSTQ